MNMITLDEQPRFEKLSYESSILTLFLSNNISEKWVTINNEKYLLQNNIVSIEVNHQKLFQLKDVHLFVDGKKVPINTDSVPQLYGKFPENNVEHSVKLLISRQNANFIKQPYLRIANAINYGYRVIESIDTQEKERAEDLLLELITLTYELNESTNCKKDKFHLRISLYYVLMQLYISMGKEVEFVGISNELIKTILFLKDSYNFKDAFYNIIKSLILINLYCNKLYKVNPCNIFALGLELGQKGFNSFDESRVEKTYLEYSEAISNLNLLKKLANNVYDEKSIFMSACRAYFNKDLSYEKFVQFNFEHKIYSLYDFRK